MSNLLRVLIADDELPARNKMKRMLGKAEQVEIVAIAENGIEALDLIHEHKPDVVFLDIEMPGLNGLDVVENIDLPTLPALIFTTAYNEHAIRAFEVNACDYLLKPFTDERLLEALDRARASQSTALTPDKMAALRRAEIVEEIRSPFSNKIPVPVRDRYKLIDFEDVVSIEVDERNVRLYTLEASYMMTHTLDQFEKRLPYDKFFRINRSAIVGLAHVQEIVIWFGNRFKVIMSNGHEIISSREKSRLIKQVLKF